MKNKTYFLLLLLTLSYAAAKAQINAYAKVTSISGTTLSLSNVNQTYHTFNNGDQIIIMQMQDNVAGSNTTNTSSFGAVSTIANAGSYEVATINSVAGLPASLTITAALTNTYNFGASSSVQIISFRKYAAPYTTTANITALAWNGNVGGVVAMQVPGTLTLANSISADGAGFRGGGVSSNYEVNCETTVYASNSSNYAAKGEGIQVNGTGFLYGRARLANGGGGGSDDNAGGGGGSNYSAGGQGGYGWTCTLATTAGGFGGDALNTYINNTRVFMGGGGGGGQQNNSKGTAGTAGGGIVIIQATTLNTSCSGPVTITANGVNASNSGNDGSGGGGAGGSIIMNIGVFNVTSPCTLTVKSNGGNGGTVNDPGSHGGGGGGGQGVIIYPAAVPTTNITNQANNGAGGSNNTPATSSAGNGAGTNGQGVLPNNGITTLAVSENNFSGRLTDAGVLLTWNAVTTDGADQFTIERSTGNDQFAAIGVVNGSVYSTNYSFTDPAPNAGMNSYRLRQADSRGTISYSTIVVVNLPQQATSTFSVFPNPVTDEFTIQLESSALGVTGTCSVLLIDMAGKTVLAKTAQPAGGRIHVTLDRKLVPGVYAVRLSNQQQTLFSKIMVR